MKKYLKFHDQCLLTGWMPKEGLCGCFPNDNHLKHFDPGPDRNGFDYFWAFDGNDNRIELDSTMIAHCYTTIRQNIVLFMAAMNNEL